MTVKLLVIGSLLILLGMTVRPFIDRFWQPGFFGRPEPTGWAGFLNRIAWLVLFPALFSQVIFKVSLDFLLVSVGTLLLAYGIFSWLALPLPLVLLSTGLTGLVLCSAYLLSSSPSLRFALAQMLLGGSASFISALRGMPDQTPTLALIRESQAVTALHWLPADANEGPERIMAAEHTQLHFWHPRRGSRHLFPRPPQELPGFAHAVITDVAVSPDNRYLAAADREGHITFFKSTVSGTPPQRFIHWQTLLNLTVDQADLELRHPGVHHLESVNALAWAPTLPYQLAFGANDHTVKVWFLAQVLTELPERRPAPTSPIARQHLLHVYRQHQQRITAAAWSPDGTHIASASADATVHIWQAATGETQQIFRRHETPLSALAWSPDGELVASASADGIVHSWRPGTGEVIMTHQGQKGAALPVAWSPDGQWLAWAGQRHTVRLWEVSTGRITIYRKHTKPVLAISWSSDGHQIASGGEDRTIRVWEAPDRR